MAWETEMVRLLRVLINDLSETPTYTDDRLQEVLLAASLQVVVQIGATDTYTVDIDELTLSPDPTDRAADTRDDAVVNLITQKAACIIDRGSAATAAAQAIAVKDGSSAIDLRGILQGKLSLLKQGWCAVYEDTLFDYLSGQRTSAGMIVMSPFRVYAYGNPTFDTDSRNGPRQIFF